MTTLIDPMKIAEWRRKALDGTMTLAETKEAVAALRAGRLAAASQPKKASAGKNPVDTASMIDELGL